MKAASAQRSMLRVLRIIMGAVGVKGQAPVLDAKGEYFVADVGRVLWATFARLRNQASDLGSRDFAAVLADEASCRAVLQLLGQPPSLTCAAGADPVAQRRVSGGGLDVHGGGVDKVTEGADDRALVRIATWNLAGGLRSAQAPKQYSLQDQRAQVVAEVLRWRADLRCDVVALQECEDAEPMKELLDVYDFVAAAPAPKTRGYVHMYVRKQLIYGQIKLDGGLPCVAATVTVPVRENVTRDVHVVAMHLPSGECRAERLRIVRQMLRACPDQKRLVLVGDWNCHDDEAEETCRQTRLKDVIYKGASWGVRGNKFFQDSKYVGNGIKFDRVMVGAGVWGEAHLVARSRVMFEGEEFHLSDHFGVFAYCDAGDVFLRRAEGEVQRTARARQEDLRCVRERAEVMEAERIQALRQSALDRKAVEQKRVKERGRQDFQRAQQQGARARQARREQLHVAAFGPESLFAEGGCPDDIVSASQVRIDAFDGIGEGSWSVAAQVGRRNLVNFDSSCYVNSIVQVLLRVPGVVEWLRWHASHSCGLRDAGLEQECVPCLLNRTLRRLDEQSSAKFRADLAVYRRAVHADYDNREQQGACEFLMAMLTRVASQEVGECRVAPWNDGVDARGDQVVRGDTNGTHVDRLFGLVTERKARCSVCNRVSEPYFVRERHVSVVADSVDGGPLTVSEMILRECGPQEGVRIACPTCGQTTSHVEQRRVVRAPNVLVLEVKRPASSRELARQGMLSRHPVAVETEIAVPGLPRMKLCGVVYHDGETTRSGHYTAACRSHRVEGRYYMFNCMARQVSAIDDEMSHVKPTQVHLVVYCNADGRARVAGAERNTRMGGSDAVGSSDDARARAVAGLGQGAGAGGSSGSGSQACDRGQKRKGIEMQGVGDRRTDGSESPVTGSERRRRVEAATAAAAGGGAAVETPPRRLRGKTARGPDESPGSAAGGASSGLQASRRRLREKTSLGSVESPGVGALRTSSAVQTPNRRRLREKTSMESVERPRSDGALGSPRHRLPENTQEASGTSAVADRLFGDVGVLAGGASGALASRISGAADVRALRAASGGDAVGHGYSEGGAAAASGVSMTTEAGGERIVTDSGDHGHVRTPGRESGESRGASVIGRGRAGRRGRGRGLAGNQTGGEGARTRDLDGAGASEGLRRSGRLAAQRVSSGGSAEASAQSQSQRAGASAQPSGRGIRIRDGVLSGPPRVSSEVGAATQRSASGTARSSARTRPIIVTGFGSERVSDLESFQRGREEEQLERASRRARDGDRGRMVDRQGRDLDRSQGGAFSLGSRR